MSTIDLSIIIVSFNVRDLLDACLKSVQESARDELRYEIIVVDNASTDGSARMVRQHYPEVRLIANRENRGFAAANNQGIRESHGRYVLLLNPDTEVLDDALAVMVAFLETHPSFGAAGPQLLYPDGSFQHSAFRFPGVLQTFFDFFPLHHRLLDSRLNGRYPRAWYARGTPFPIDHPLGACLMARRATVEQVGLLDEGFFMYCEEIDWCWRMREAGWQIACVPHARVIHHAGASASQFRDAMFVALWRSRFRLYAKHLPPWRQRLIRWIVRVGLQWKRLRVHSEAACGNAIEAEVVSRLTAYEQVARMARGGSENGGWRMENGDWRLGGEER